MLLLTTCALVQLSNLTVVNTCEISHMVTDHIRKANTIVEGEWVQGEIISSSCGLHMRNGTTGALDGVTCEVVLETLKEKLTE